jgi:hypothetical protein
VGGTGENERIGEKGRGKRLRDKSKGTAACWDYGWYLVLDGQQVCVLTDHEKELSVMPMKCKDKRK